MSEPFVDNVNEGGGIAKVDVNAYVEITYCFKCNICMVKIREFIIQFSFILWTQNINSITL